MHGTVLNPIKVKPRRKNRKEWKKNSITYLHTKCAITLENFQNAEKNLKKIV